MQDADGNNAFHVAVLAGNDLAVRLMYDAYELADAVAVGAHLHPLDKRNSQGKKPADVLDGKAFPSDVSGSPVKRRHVSLGASSGDLRVKKLRDRSFCTHRASTGLPLLLAAQTYICARALAMYLRDEEGALERRTRLMMEQEDLAACVPLGVVPVHKLGMVIGMLRQVIDDAATTTARVGQLSLASLLSSSACRTTRRSLTPLVLLLSPPQLPDMVHLRTMSGMTWFHIAAASSGPRSFELMELLADGGLDVNTASYSGRSSTSARARQGGKRPLHIAAYHGSWMGGERRAMEDPARPHVTHASLLENGGTVQASRPSLPT